MHKYKPRVHVMEQDSGIDLSLIQSLPIERVKTFSFRETEFTTVTAYQNQQVKQSRIREVGVAPEVYWDRIWDSIVWFMFSTGEGGRVVVLLYYQVIDDRKLCGSFVKEEIIAEGTSRQRRQSS